MSPANQKYLADERLDLRQAFADQQLFSYGLNAASKGLHYLADFTRTPNGLGFLDNNPASNLLGIGAGIVDMTSNVPGLNPTSAMQLDQLTKSTAEVVTGKVIDTALVAATIVDPLVGGPITRAVGKIVSGTEVPSEAVIASRATNLRSSTALTPIGE